MIYLLALLFLHAFADEGEADVSTVEAVIVVSRHANKATINNYDDLLGPEIAKDIFQDYGVPNGHLTDHGRKLAKMTGKIYQAYYGEKFFKGEATCADVAQNIVIYADLDERDITSGNLFLEGWAENSGLTCAGDDALKSVETEWEEILMNEGKTQFLYEGCPYASEEEVGGLVGQDVDQYLKDNFGQTIKEIGEFYGCCQPAMCDGKEPCKLEDIPNVWKGGYWSSWSGGMKYAANLARTLQTQYVDGAPVFKDATLEQITRWYGVTSASWRLYKNRINKNRFGGNLMSYIVAALMQAATGEKQITHMPEKAPKLAWFMSHDVNVAFLQDYLQAQTSMTSYPYEDSSIFIGAVVLELHKIEGEHKVSVWHCGSSMDEIRELKMPNLEDYCTQVSIPICKKPLMCELDELVKMLVMEIQTTGPEGKPCLDDMLAEYINEMSEEVCEAKNYGRVMKGEKVGGKKKNVMTDKACRTLCVLETGAEAFEYNMTKKTCQCYKSKIGGELKLKMMKTIVGKLED